MESNPETLPSTARDWRKLEQLVREGKMTPDGRDWLISYLDPFHDGTIATHGYPDQNTAGSVVQVIKQTKTISAPTGSGNWDFHCIMGPWASGLSTASTVPPTNFSQVGTSDSSNWWFINAASGQDQAQIPAWGGQAVPAGVQTFGAGSIANTVQYALDPSAYIVGSCRVIGMAMEIINITADLYKGGAVTCYRQPHVPSSSTPLAGWLSYTGTAAAPTNLIGPYPMMLFDGFPQSVANARLIPNSTQWSADQGAYLVSPMQKNDNPPQIIGPTWMGYINGGTLATAGAMMAPVSISKTVNGMTAEYFPENMLLPFEQSGAYFTNLTNQSALQVNVVWIIERFPTIDETDMIVLAKPSPGYDACALEIASSAVRELPIAVPATMNPLGEWFDTIVDAVLTYGPGAASSASILFPEAAPFLLPAAGLMKATDTLYPKARREQRKRERKLKKLANAEKNALPRRSRK